MNSLSKPLRNQLKSVLMDAREKAENAAINVLNYLGVASNTCPDSLGDVKQVLRRKLRAHGRLLGDKHSLTGEQETALLAEEIAYEHWNRMFFVRTLSENDFLTSPNPDGSGSNKVRITLEECEDLAKKENGLDVWRLAAKFSASLLPQIFRVDSPIFELQLFPEDQQDLEKQLRTLPTETFKASDTLGWIYQYWQTKKKDEINKSGVKVGARELPVVTQIFSESYMVAFLLDNSVGAWWAVQRLSGVDWNGDTNEVELRTKAALPGVALKYLRFAQSDGRTWVPAAGAFEDWPKSLDKFRLLDPCCGSGHFLVAALHMLVPMRMKMEGIDARAAVEKVLEENLYGLELDRRCVELAAFALNMAAWRYPDGGGVRPLQSHIACSGCAINAKKETWLSLAQGERNLEILLGETHKIFQNAGLLGSLIDPELSTEAIPLLGRKWGEIRSPLKEALSKEKTQSVEHGEIGVVAQGVAEATEILTKRYHCIVTNVPFLSRRKQHDKLRKFCEEGYPEAKHELAAVFLERILKMCAPGGACNLVLPQKTFSLKSYQKFQKKLLRNNKWRLSAILGSNAFAAVPLRVQVILLSVSRANNSPSEAGAEVSPRRFYYRLNVGVSKTASEKACALPDITLTRLSQEEQLQSLDALDDCELLSVYAEALTGFSTGDDSHFKCFFWELPSRQQDWFYFQGSMKAGEKNGHYGGRHYLLWYGKELNEALSLGRAVLRGKKAWGRQGVVVNQMLTLPCALYSGDRFDANCAVVLPNSAENLEAIWCFCSAPEYHKAVRRLDQELKVTNATLAKVPFDLKRWKNVATKKYPNGLPKPYSDDPTQWIFHGHPARAKHRSGEVMLQVAVARLLGYRWSAEQDAELGTSLSEEARDWVLKSKELFRNDYVDADGIVCIPAVSGEISAAERLQRLLELADGNSESSRIKNGLLVQMGVKDGDAWLRNKFFAEHCKLFRNRPFIWHIWDGLRDGFSALVNYHQLDYKRLEVLVHRYLADWLALQNEHKKDKKDGAEERHDAAEALKKSLERILKGENPYDIFVRWKPIEQQAVGWHPDVNDGVRLNIRPFMKVPDVREKGAGVLRTKPNINWKIDKGRDLPSAPWYETFGSTRTNDHHLDLEEKKRARNEKSENDSVSCA